MNDLQNLRTDVKQVRLEIASLVGDLLDTYPGTSIDYGSIWLKGKKGKKKVKVRLDVKV